MTARVAALTAAIAVIAAAPVAADAAPSSLARKLAREQRALGPASGVLVRDLTTGATLYSSRPDELRVPASVNKLYATATALLLLGPERTLDTTVVGPATLAADGSLDGDVTLVGAGDPFLGRKQIGLLARAMAAGGITSVGGRVRGDGTLFDGRRGGPRTGYAYDRDMGGVLGGLVMARGFASGRAVADPAKPAAVELARALRAREVGARSGAPRPADADAIELARVSSDPVATLIRRINQPSDNFAAEMLVKAVAADSGRPGTTTHGVGRVRRAMRRLGLSPRIADGSGLSRSNRTSPRQVVRLLTVVARRPVGRAFERSLAVAGRSGTLADRMRRGAARGRCHAKTGTLRDVSALAGYCNARNGHVLAFAILANGVNPTAAKRREDAMAAAIARYN